MKAFLVQLVLTALALLVVAHVVGGVYVGGFGTALGAAPVFLATGVFLLGAGCLSLKGRHTTT